MGRGLTLDAGALIGVERSTRLANLLVERARERRERISIPAGALAQVWRDGRRQARLARLLSFAEVTVVPMDDFVARASGQLCGVAGTADVVDAAVVICAKMRNQAIVTSDPDDLRRLDPTVRLLVV